MLEPHTLFFQKFNTRQLLRPFGNSSVVSMILIRLAFSFALLRAGRQAAAYSRLAALAGKLPGGGPAVAARRRLSAACTGSAAAEPRSVVSCFLSAALSFGAPAGQRSVLAVPFVLRG